MINLLINNANLEHLFRSFKAISLQSFNDTEVRWPKIATLVPSTTAQTDYGWMNQIPSVREWIGERQVQNLSTSTYSIRNRDFELTVGVDRNSIADDQIGIFSPMLQMMGESVARAPDELIFDLLVRGFEEKCYDGKAFFAANHPVGRKAFSNMGTGKLTRQELRNAITQMQTLVNDQGRPLRLFQIDGSARKPLLCIGPANRSNALDIIGVSTLPQGGTNPDYGTAEIVVLPELVGDAADNWFLMDVTRAIKPMILQRRKEPEFVRKDDVRDDNVFNQRQFIYGFDSRMNAGFSFPQLAYGSTGSTAGA